LYFLFVPDARDAGRYSDYGRSRRLSAMLAERESKSMLFQKEKYHLVRLKVDGAEALSEKIWFCRGKALIFFGNRAILITSEIVFLRM